MNIELPLAEEVLLFRAIAEDLRRFRQTWYPAGKVVQVECGQFKGYGITAGQDDSAPADQLPVRLENGNVWWYPIECCCLRMGDKDSERLPAWIKRERGIA